jgi:hypothetical protein
VFVSERTVPILPSRDIKETDAFYRRLGFVRSGGDDATDWGDYLMIERGALELHFFAEPDVDPLSTAQSCYVYVDDADGLYAQWAAIGVEPDPATGSRLTEPRDTEWMMREFALVDRSGNLLRVGSPMAR